MDENNLQIIENCSKNEKKRFYELFHSLSTFLYSNSKSLTSSSVDIGFYQEICKTVDNLQKLKESQITEIRCQKTQLPQGSSTPLNKKIYSDKYEIKTKNFVHHEHTFSVGNDKKLKNGNKTVQNSIICKEFEKNVKNLENKLHIDQKSKFISHSHNIQSSSNNNSFLDISKNAMKQKSNNGSPYRSKSKDLEKNTKLPPLSPQIKFKKYETKDIDILSVKKSTEPMNSEDNEIVGKKKSRSVYQAATTKKEMSKFNGKIMKNNNFGAGSYILKDINSRKMQIISKLTKKDGV